MIEVAISLQSPHLYPFPRYPFYGITTSSTLAVYYISLPRAVAADFIFSNRRHYWVSFLIISVSSFTAFSKPQALQQQKNINLVHFFRGRGNYFLINFCCRTSQANFCRGNQHLYKKNGFLSGDVVLFLCVCENNGPVSFHKILKVCEQ